MQFKYNYCINNNFPHRNDVNKGASVCTFSHFIFFLKLRIFSIIVYFLMWNFDWRTDMLLNSHWVWWQIYSFLLLCVHVHVNSDTKRMEELFTKNQQMKEQQRLLTENIKTLENRYRCYISLLKCVCVCVSQCAYGIKWHSIWWYSKGVEAWTWKCLLASVNNHIPRWRKVRSKADL